jgi:DivIVA domain-containing protein
VVTFLALLGVLGVLFAAAVLSTREGPVLADAPPDAADVPLPEEPLAPEDVGRLRFSLAARGYRMSEVDLALERLARELADRDRRIALLEAAAEGHQTPASVREATVEDLPAPPPEPEPAPLPVAPPAPAEAPAYLVPPAEAPQEAPQEAPPAAAVPQEAPPVALPPEAPAYLVPPEAAVPQDAAEPAAVPADPTDEADPLPPADLGAELLSEERAEQAATEPSDDRDRSHP